jgi:hypothetical protein
MARGVANAFDPVICCSIGAASASVNRLQMRRPDTVSRCAEKSLVRPNLSLLAFLARFYTSGAKRTQGDCGGIGCSSRIKPFSHPTVLFFGQAKNNLQRRGPFLLL